MNIQQFKEYLNRYKINIYYDKVKLSPDIKEAYLKCVEKENNIQIVGNMGTMPIKIGEFNINRLKKAMWKGGRLVVSSVNDEGGYPNKYYKLFFEFKKTINVTPETEPLIEEIELKYRED